MNTRTPRPIAVSAGRSCTTHGPAPPDRTRPPASLQFPATKTGVARGALPATPTGRPPRTQARAAPTMRRVPTTRPARGASLPRGGVWGVGTDESAPTPHTPPLAHGSSASANGAGPAIWTPTPSSAPGCDTAPPAESTRTGP